MNCVINKSFKPFNKNSKYTILNHTDHEFGIENDMSIENEIVIDNYSNIGDECPICITEFSKKDNVVELKCKHRFHYDCIINVKSNNCPVCRKKIMDIDTCDGKHFTHFSNSHLTKKGKCTFCLKGTFAYYIKNRLKENKTINFN